MRPSFAFLISLFLGAGFFLSGQSGTTVVDSIKVGGNFRTYRLYIPPAYSGTKSVPLLLNFHGLGSNAAQQQIYGNFMPVSDTAGFLMVLPDGSKSGTSQFWNAGLLPAPDDVEFIDRLLDSLFADYTIDHERVYACGISNGGIFSYYLACTLGHRITAVASVAGTMFRNWFTSCVPMYATPVMEVHGTEDGTVPYNGEGGAVFNGLYMPVDSVILKWVQHNRCSDQPVVIQVPDTDQTDLSTATNFRYISGADGSAVELYKVEGGSHSWPGSLPIFFKTNLDFNASAEIWRFFSAFRSAQFTTRVSVTEEERMAQRFIVYPNPARDELFFSSGTTMNVSLYDASGRRVLETAESPLSLKHLPKGLYLLQAGNDRVRISRKVIKE